MHSEPPSPIVGRLAAFCIAAVALCLNVHSEAFGSSEDSWLDDYFTSSPDFLGEIAIRPGTAAKDLPGEWLARDGKPESSIMAFSRNYDGSSGRIWCVKDRVVLEEWKFPKGKCRIMLEDSAKYAKGIYFGSGFEWTVRPGGVLCLVEYHTHTRPEVERLVFMDLNSATNRFPYSSFSLANLPLGNLRYGDVEEDIKVLRLARLGMISKEIEILQFIEYNKWNRRNCVKTVAGFIVPALMVVGEIGDAVERHVNGGLNVEIKDGFVVAISRRYEKDLVDKLGGYDTLQKEVSNQIGNPTSTKSSRYYIYKKSAQWDIPKQDVCVKLEQDDNCVCTLSVSVRSLKAK